MQEPIITNEVEHALLRMHYEPTEKWSHDQPRVASVVLEEREKNSKCARRILDTFYEVSREFCHIDLGLVD